MEKFRWSSKVAYAVGLFATDGHLSIDGRHLDLTSKDIEQLENFKVCLELGTKISWKSSGYGKRCPHVQFGSVKLYRWLLSIGVKQKKTKTIGALDIPDRYFFDFLRGHFDGDGCVYAYFDPRWKSSYLIYLQFVSASRKHLVWLQRTIKRLAGHRGRINYAGKSTYQLRFAKYASLDLFKKMYYKEGVVSLSRKRKKFEAFVKQAGVVELAYTTG